MFDLFTASPAGLEFKKTKPEVVRVQLLVDSFYRLFDQCNVDVRIMEDFAEVDSTVMTSAAELTEEECARVLSKIFDKVKNIESDEGKKSFLLTHNPLRALLTRARDIQEASL